MVRIFLLIVTVLVLGLAGLAYWLAWRALPDLDGIVSITELSQPVRVRFDQWAVPYIEARSLRDMNMSQGYVTASDRMFQMDILRRAALGRLSEIFGAGCLAHDKLVRTIGFNRIASEQYKKLSPECKNDLRAYTAGVNAYISQSSGKPGLAFLCLGYKPRPWEPEDSLAILKFLQYELDESWRLDEFRTRLVNKVGIKLASALCDQPLNQKNVSTTFAPQENFVDKKIGQLIVNSSRSWGSSAWALSGQISSTHGCLIACDKHGPFTCPDLWYSCSLSAPEVHVSGATIPGVPGVIFGRNNNIAWAVNALKADVQDLFVEQFSDKFPAKYRVANGWSTADELTEEISQRFGPNLLHKINSTRHGPILFRNDAVAVSLSWTGFNEKGSALETIRNLNKAKDWADFRDALKTYDGSPSTFIFADTKGNVGMQVAGAMPIRATGGHGVVYSSAPTVLSGASDDGKWLGQVKFDDLPSSFNAPDGFVIANDTKQSGIPNDANPVLAVRVRDVLTQYRKSAQHPDLPEMSALQFDQQGYLLPLVKSELEKAMTRTSNVDAFAQEGLTLLGHSNGQLRGDSAASTIYEAFLTTILRRTLGQKLDPALLNEYVQRCPNWSAFVGHVLKDKPHDLLPAEERDYESFLLTSFAESIKNIRVALKTDDPKHWTWKSLHQIDYQKGSEQLTMGIPDFLAIMIFPQQVGVGGDQDCINNCNYELSGLPASYKCTSGPTMRTLMDLSDSDKFYQTLSLGQSEHLLSNHRTDQLRSWLDGELHPIAFSDKQLEKQLQHTLILTNHE